MNVEITYVVGLLITIIGAFWGMAKLLLSQSQTQINRQFELIQAHMNKQDADSRKLEREVQDIKLFAAREYVTKGEYNQQVAMIVTKLDWFGERIETVLLRMGGAK